jgi:hypothetical protein
VGRFVHDALAGVTLARRELRYIADDLTWRSKFTLFHLEYVDGRSG